MSGLLRVVPRGIPWLTVASRGLLWHPVVLRLLACLASSGLPLSPAASHWPPRPPWLLVASRGLPLSPVASRDLQICVVGNSTT
jgi:hypothetical protein